MTEQELTFWMSLASFATSTVLAIIKLIEFFGTNKIKLKATPMLTTSSDLGHTITVLNDSEIPITISYFELAWVEKRKLFALIPIPFTRKVVQRDSPIDPPEGYYVLVAPHETDQMAFRDEYQFDWGPELKQAVYLAIWIIGHDKPFWLYVTGPN